LTTKGINEISTKSNIEYTHLLPPVTSENTKEFIKVFNSVKLAISKGIYPERISKGSSGSYFCKDINGNIVAVFKPKNEEPYGHLNPKWSKWIHKNLFPCCFGRDCLITNNGYLSEVAASYIDRILLLNCVPRTEIVYLSSPTFHYSKKDHQDSLKSNNPLPSKIGSFQLFLNNYKDATTFFKQGYQKIIENSTSNNNFTLLKNDYDVLPSSETSTININSRESNESTSTSNNNLHPLNFNNDMKKQFQLGFERLVILDYIIRNTDRGLDNWMVKLNDIDVESNYISFDQPSSSSVSSVHNIHNNNNHNRVKTTSTNTSFNSFQKKKAKTFDEHSLDNLGEISEFDNLININSNNISNNDIDFIESSTHLQDFPLKESIIKFKNPKVEIAAIDNGLAFPIKHPDQYRSYPYGWSFLSISHIPFSQESIEFILPKLENEKFQRYLFYILEQVMKIDEPFDKSLFENQKAVMRGQICNLIEILRRNESPYQLIKRPNVLVYEEIELFEDYSDTSKLIEDFKHLHDKPFDIIDKMELIFDDMKDKSKKQYIKIKKRFETLTREPWFSWC
jgi:hypothetical protein